MATTGVLSSWVDHVVRARDLRWRRRQECPIPLHDWLPDAMEGPTPVSALIHAATMVAAGVYLVARFYPVFETSADARHVVAWIGGITALLGATIALVQTDYKKVLAYSTISQLGYMMMALGTFGYVAAIFHLFTHAFFKSLLFLGGWLGQPRHQHVRHAEDGRPSRRSCRSRTGPS